MILILVTIIIVTSLAAVYYEMGLPEDDTYKTADIISWPSPLFFALITVVGAATIALGILIL